MSSRSKATSTSKTPSSTASNGKGIKPSSVASTSAVGLTPAVEPPRSKSRAEAPTPRDIDLDVKKSETKPSANKVQKGKGRGKLKVEVSIPIPVSPIKSTPIAQSEDIDMEDSAPSAATPPPHTPSLSPIEEGPTTPLAQVMTPFDSGPEPAPPAHLNGRTEEEGEEEEEEEEE